MNSSQPADKDTEPRPEEEKSFGYSEAVDRILAIEREVARLRVRFDEILAGTCTRPAESAHSADRPSAPQPLTSAEWDPRRKIECPECGEAISADSLRRHRRRAHLAASAAEGDGT